MSKLFSLTSLLLTLGLLAALPAFAAQDSSSSSTVPSSNNSKQSSSSSMGQSQGAVQIHAFDVSDLIGKTVKDKRGHTLGKVKDLVIGSDGAAQFVIMARGGFIDINQKYVPIPFRTFMSDVTNLANVHTHRNLIATLDRKKLDNAPTFSGSKWSKMKSSKDKICSYYGPGQCSKTVM